MRYLIRRIAELIGNSIKVTPIKEDETLLIATGRLLSNQQFNLNSTNINDFEFKIFSEYGDDGIIQYLIKNIYIKNEILFRIKHTLFDDE